MRLVILVITSCCLFFSSISAAQGGAPASDGGWSSPQQLSEELLLRSPRWVPLLGGNPLLPDQVQQRYGVNVFSAFPLVLIINKAERGPTAQRLRAYYRGQWMYTFAISTGRERFETAPSGRSYFTSTPTGWYSPIRYEIHHESTTWEAPMDYAIFFTGGVAVHATTPSHFKTLGQRASGGCVRMFPRDALWIWDTSLGVRQAQVPVFGRDGSIAMDGYGHPRYHVGSGTLIIVYDRPDL